MALRLITVVVGVQLLTRLTKTSETNFTLPDACERVKTRVHSSRIDDLLGSGTPHYPI